MSRYLRVEDVAELLGCSRDVLQRRAAKCAIPHRRIGGTRRLLFIESEISAWIDGADLETIATANGGRVVRPIAGNGRPR